MQKWEMKREHKVLIGILIIGTILRYIMLLTPYNFDFESYCIVGDLVTQGENVYASTFRYNYGFFFSVIQGVAWWLSGFWGDQQTVFRVLIVSVLTLADLGIFAILYKKYSLRAAGCFYLSLVSIAITGQHHQFDNISVLLFLIAICFFNTENDFSKNDFLFVLFFSASLIMKHIFFVFPVWILFNNRLSIKKKLLYAFVPPAIFLLSFVPFAIGNQNALYGIIKNVFMYRSYNNAPLLSLVYRLMNLPDQYWIIGFIGCMVLVGFLYRKSDIDHQMLIYLLALLAFSSEIANQYLAIPLVSICVLTKEAGTILYNVLEFLYLCVSDVGLQINKMSFLSEYWLFQSEGAYFAAALMCLGILAWDVFCMKKEQNSME